MSGKTMINGSNCPSVYFVVINWNQPKLTIECLASLKRQEYDNFKVILVDNGSTDDSVTQIRQAHPWVEVLSLAKNVGYSGGNNVGIEAALRERPDYILLLNNDTDVAPDMLTKLVSVAESAPNIGIVGPTMFYADPADTLWGGANYIQWRTGTLNRSRMGESLNMNELAFFSPVETDYIDTCAAMFKRRVLEEVGFMNTDYFINFDDLDLNIRTVKLGYKAVYVPAAVMWHKVSVTMGAGSPATTYYMTRNALMFFWRQSPGLLRYPSVTRILGRTIRTIGAWSFRSKYRTELYRKRRNANIIAVRDFMLGKSGQMSAAAERVCYDN